MRPLILNDLIEEAEDKTGNSMRACSPTTSASLRLTKPVCGGVEAYNERSYIFSIVAKGYRLCVTSPPILLKNQWEI